MINGAVHQESIMIVSMRTTMEYLNVYSKTTVAKTKNKQKCNNSWLLENHILNN